MIRKVVVAVSLGFALTGCAREAPPPAPVERPEPPLTFEEWDKIADPEEKFNRHTLQRLPKDQLDKARRAYPKKF